MGNCADRNGSALLDIMHRLALNSTVINNTYSFGLQLKKIKNTTKVYEYFRFVIFPTLKFIIIKYH